MGKNSSESLIVVISAEGYPENPKKGGKISFITTTISFSGFLEEKYGVKIFFAGIKEIDGKLTANGGRVLSICKTGADPRKDIYAAAEALEFEDKFYRKDIGETLCKSL